MPLDLTNNQFLGKAEIKERASSVFTAQGAPETSQKYSHISTDRIIEDMEALGWGVIDAKQVRARNVTSNNNHQDTIFNNSMY